ncbi:MAG: hypothetical protein J0I90_07325, partial [Nitrosospira sp.]|nr:hypothetical protein [Nitrosospira sp.]
NPAVGQGEVCGFWRAGQGAMTRNDHSIPGSCNAAMCRKNRAIRPCGEPTIQVDVECRQKALWIMVF